MLGKTAEITHDFEIVDAWRSWFFQTPPIMEAMIVARFPDLSYVSRW